MAKKVNGTWYGLSSHTTSQDPRPARCLERWTVLICYRGYLCTNADAYCTRSPQTSHGDHGAIDLLLSCFYAGGTSRHWEWPPRFSWLFKTFIPSARRPPPTERFTIIPSLERYVVSLSTSPRYFACWIGLGDPKQLFILLWCDFPFVYGIACFYLTLLVLAYCRSG